MYCVWFEHFDFLPFSSIRASNRLENCVHTNSLEVSCSGFLDIVSFNRSNRSVKRPLRKFGVTFFKVSATLCRLKWRNNTNENHKATKQKKHDEYQRPLYNCCSKKSRIFYPKLFPWQFFCFCRCSLSCNQYAIYRFMRIQIQSVLFWHFKYIV